MARLCLLKVTSKVLVSLFPQVDAVALLEVGLADVVVLPVAVSTQWDCRAVAAARALRGQVMRVVGRRVQAHSALLLADPFEIAFICGSVRAHVGRPHLGIRCRARARLRRVGLSRDGCRAFNVLPSLPSDSLLNCILARRHLFGNIPEWTACASPNFPCSTD